MQKLKVTIDEPVAVSNFADWPNCDEVYRSVSLKDEMPKLSPKSYRIGQKVPKKCTANTHTDATANNTGCLLADLESDTAILVALIALAA